MSATITDTLKTQLIQQLYDDVRSESNNYFIGIGRSDAWGDSDVSPLADGSRRGEMEYRLALQSVKLAETVSFVVPRSNWSNGTVYDAYNDSVFGYSTNDYYVLTDANAVYVCLEQGKDASGIPVPSTVEPLGASLTSFKTSDGYVWKFLYTLNASAASAFLSANFLPVKIQEATDSDSPATDIEQEAVQNAAIEGQIGSINVIAQGAGYSSTPAVLIEGDGAGASASATLLGTNVVKVEMDQDSDGTVLHGSGYTFAKVSLVGGSPSTSATLQAVISPVNGFGADPRNDLKSSGLMFNTKPDGTEEGSFIVGNDFRQIGLLKNITLDDSDGLYNLSAGLALNSLALNTVASAFTVDRIIQGTTSGAQAIVDFYDVSNSKLFFHQNYTTGFDNFQDGEQITEVSGSGSAVLASSDATVAGDINPYSGEVLYIENRQAIDRAPDQAEDIKLVIKF